MTHSGRRAIGNRTSVHELPRVLGLGSVVGIVVGNIIGSGIFIVPAMIAAAVKSPVLILAVWMVGGVLSLFGTLAFAELGAAYPHAGGMYVFLREAYGPFLAFLFGWTLFLVIDSGSVATLSMAFASKYLPYFVPLGPVAIKIVALLFVFVLVAVNYVGTRWGARVQNTFTLVKFAAVIGIASLVLVLGDGNMANFAEPRPESFSLESVGAFGLALVATLWAYKGWEAPTFSAGETKNPERNLPLGLLGGCVAVIALYMVTNMAYIYVIPAGQIATSDRIAADAMNLAVGTGGATIISLIILFSITGAANGVFLTAPRVFYAMARDGLFFKKFASVHPRYLTPHVSILATGVWAALLSLSGTFEQLASYVIFGLWIFFGLTVAAVIVLRRKRPELPRPYRTWGFPVTPVIFILASLYISVNALITQPLNALAGLGIILLGAPAYLYWRRGTTS